MSALKYILYSNVVLLFLASAGIIGKVYQRAEVVNKSEKISLKLMEENRKLKNKVNDLTFKVSELKNKNDFLSIRLKEKRDRLIASIGPVDSQNDLVKQQTFQWGAEQLITMGRDELAKKNYVRSAQLFQTLLKEFPQHPVIDDTFYFQLGISSYESKVYNEWGKSAFNKIVEIYPSSEYFRGAKLWLGLLSLREGRKKDFFNTVEEFRKKYRNTAEWELISRHYDSIYKNYRE